MEKSCFPSPTAASGHSMTDRSPSRSFDPSPSPASTVPSHQFEHHYQHINNLRHHQNPVNLNVNNPAISSSSLPVLHIQVIKVRAEDEHLAKAVELLAFRFPSHARTANRRDFCSSASSNTRPSPLGLSPTNHGFPVWDSVQ